MSNNNSKKSLYLQQGNLQFCGSVKIGQITLTNQQFKQLLLDNISWKRYIVYPKGQVCSIKHQNYTQFYYSLQSNNIGNNPSTSIEYWKPIVIDNNNSSNDLIFKIPYIQSGDFVFLEVQFSVDETFNDAYIINSYDVYSSASSQSCSSDSSCNFESNVFYISDPSNNDIRVLSNQLITSVYSNQILIFKINSISSVFNYFRYRWFSQNNNGYTKYYFGVVNSQIQTFDSQNISSSVVNVDNQNITGNGTQSNPLKLSKNISINKIIGGDNFEIKTNDSNITINSANGNGQLNLQVSDIKLNNNEINSPNGIVVLNSNGKIDQNLYVDGDFNNRLLPLKSSVSQQFFGNPLVIHKVGQVQTNIQVDSSTILLIQGATKTNQANNHDGVVYQNYIFGQKQQNFKGGYIIGVSENELNNILQFTIQIENKDLSQLYRKSVFQHFTQSGKLCCLSVNSDGFVFESQQKKSQQIEFQSFGNVDYYKFVIQYKYNGDSQNYNYYADIYCNGQLCTTFQFDEYPFGKQDGDYIYFYIGQQISRQSAINYLNGIDTYWRLLKIDLSLKDEEINKMIGQLYSNQTNIDYTNIKVDYNWSYTENTDNAFVFGKKDNIPCIFPYHNFQPNLPTASKTIKGGVIIGNGLYVDANGVLSVNTQGVGFVDLGNYVQVSSQTNNNGNINIRSSVSPNSTITIQSGNIQNNNIGGILFLGNDSNKFCQLKWVDDNYLVRVGQMQSLIKNGDSQVTITNDSINLKTEKLFLNGIEPNKENGLVQLNENGKIPNELLNITNDNGIVFENRVVVYATDTNNSYQCNGIKAGNGVTIAIQNGVAVINADQNGDLRSDIQINYGDLTKENNRYTYIVKNINLGGFVVQDNNGYMIYPLMRQISVNGNNSVQIDLTQFVGENGLRQNELNEQHINYRVKFVRGYKGNDGQLTKDQALNMILTYLM